MSWTPEQAHKAEDEQKASLMRLHTEGRYVDLCNAYCHEGWSIYRDGAGDIIDMGICSYRAYGGTEDDALATVAAHIKAEVLAGVLGC